MKVIVQTVTEGITGSVEVEHDQTLWMEKALDGRLRIYVFDDDIEYVVALFAPDCWRSAVVVHAPAQD